MQITVISEPKTAAVGIIAELLKTSLEVEDFVPLTREEAHERGIINLFKNGQF